MEFESNEYLIWFQKVSAIESTAGMGHVNYTGS